MLQSGYQVAIKHRWCHVKVVEKHFKTKPPLPVVDMHPFVPENIYIPYLPLR
jgi:hypothetical protein